MSSHHPEKQQAHWGSEVLPDEKRREILLDVLPMGEFRASREEVVEMYSVVYKERKEIQSRLSKTSNAELRERAFRYGREIPNYDPHGVVTAVTETLDSILNRVRHLSSIAILVGILFSVNWIRQLGIRGFSSIDALEGLMPVSFIAFGIVYIWFLEIDTFVHQTLGTELRAGSAELYTRNRSRIVGYYVWNGSLLGQTGLLLVGFFTLLRMLPKLPLLGNWFDRPDRFIVSLVNENVDEIFERDGYLDLIRTMWGKYVVR